MSNNSIEWLKESKCQYEECYNYRMHGYIYCVLHLYDFPEEMDEEDIKRLKFNEECIGSTKNE
jgi:hypothetical protein